MKDLPRFERETDVAMFDGHASPGPVIEMDKLNVSNGLTDLIETSTISSNGRMSTPSSWTGRPTRRPVSTVPSVPSTPLRRPPAQPGEGPTTLALAHSEFTQIVRNRAVLMASLIVSLAAAVSLIYFYGAFERIGSLGYIEAMIVFTVAAFSLYATAVTTLAARRQSLFRKRLRSTAAGDETILWGLVVPVSVFSLLQSGVTNATEQAQVTTLHISLGIVVIANWVAITGTESFTWLKRLLPGVATAELIVDVWNGGIPLTNSLLVLAPILSWVVVAIALARWEARR